MIYSGSGHRPPVLGLDYTEKSDVLLTDWLTARLDQIVLDSKVDAKWYGDDECLISGIISGAANGFDLAFAEAAINLKIPLTLAIPFCGFGANWPMSSQNRLWRAMTQAHRVHYVSDHDYIHSQQYIDRDHWMVDNSDGLICLYSGLRKSGTGATVAYANTLKRPIINLWDNWKNYRAKQNQCITADNVMGN